MTSARLKAVALDCRDPHALADFYSQITGWPISDQDEDDWVDLASPIGATIACQLSPDHEAPTWPTGGRPQQIHLDFEVDDLDIGELRVLELGATKHDVQPGTAFRVYLDPAGHPFCLVLPND